MEVDSGSAPDLGLGPAPCLVHDPGHHENVRFAHQMVLHRRTVWYRQTAPARPAARFVGWVADSARLVVAVVRGSVAGGQDLPVGVQTAPGVIVVDGVVAVADVAVGHVAAAVAPGPAVIGFAPVADSGLVAEVVVVIHPAQKRDVDVVDADAIAADCLIGRYLVVDCLVGRQSKVFSSRTPRTTPRVPGVRLCPKAEVSKREETPVIAMQSNGRTSFQCSSEEFG